MKQVVEKRSDIVFFIKMFPLAKIHPESYKKSKAIMCAKTNEESLSLLEAAFEKKPLPEPSCTTDVIEKNTALAGSLGISGTPTIIFGDGSRMTGALKADSLIDMATGKK